MEPLTDRQLEIANMSASGYSVAEMSAITGLTDELICNVLDLPSVKRYRQITVDNLEMDVNIKRLSGGKKVLDKVITGIQNIVDTIDAKKWNMVHFKMFEWLAKEIPKVQKETKSLQAVQINLNKENEQSKLSPELDRLLESLPIEKKLEFFDKSEAMLRAMVKEEHEPTQ